jgi:crotonobetainyl-CoA:carnitine CoA-transferase CaiB-like acyl-CoA transferase
MTKPLRPLDGIRVIETASFLAGPFCTTQLAEFGAEVIKCELPGVGDPLRKFGSPHACGETLPFLSECRNKKSVTLDIRKPEGAQILKDLVAKSDVLVENFQPGTLEKWGLGWDELSAINPRLVMVRISGYGQTGPYSGRPGFGRIANAFGGLSYLAGYPDRPPVTPGSATIPDYLAGIYGAFGALLALRARDVHGKGQVVDIGLYEPVFRILDELTPAFDTRGFVRERMGPGTVNVVPHSHYPTQDKKWIAIACTSDKIYERLAEAMIKSGMAAPERWVRLAERERDRADVDAHVARWTSSMPKAQVLDICDDAQIPCGSIYAIDEIFQDQQYAARDNIARIADPRFRGKTLAVPNVVPRLTETPGGIDHLGPPLGAHTAEVYASLLGLPEAKQSELKAAGVI